MKTKSFVVAKKLPFLLTGFACGILYLAPAGAQSTSSVTRVEEDWEMDVVFAKDDLGAPQIVTFMSPNSSSAGTNFSFEINFSTLPEADNGGLQVHAWIDSESFDFQNPPTDRALERKHETIRWTQVMEVQDGNVTFSINEFRSTSLGNFDDDPLLRVSMPSSLSDLAAYQTSQSVSEAGIPFALNRVNEMSLKDVRFYNGDSLITENHLDINVLNQ